MSSPTIFPPDLDDVLGELKTEIFAQLNCVQIGKVETYDKTAQTAEVQIQVKRRVKGEETRSYPLLVDCPVFVLQGGGSYFDMPIAAGDYCLVLFNDRDIDTWWSGGQVAEPPTRRKHSLSDGFALVGINPSPTALNLDGSAFRMVDANGNIIAMRATGITITDTNGIQVIMNVSGLTLDSGDASTWLPNILPADPFTGIPHGGPTAGIVKLRGS